RRARDRCGRRPGPALPRDPVRSGHADPRVRRPRVGGPRARVLDVDRERATASQLTPWQRWALVVPLAGGAGFGLLPLLVPVQIATATGYSGDDPFVGRLAGAATFGYAVALALGIREGRWPALRAVVVATLTFNIISLIACAIEIGADRATAVVFLIG